MCPNGAGINRKAKGTITWASILGIGRLRSEVNDSYCCPVLAGTELQEFS